MIVAITAKCKRDAKRRAKKCRSYFKHAKIMSVKRRPEKHDILDTYIVVFRVTLVKNK